MYIECFIVANIFGIQLVLTHCLKGHGYNKRLDRFFIVAVYGEFSYSIDALKYRIGIIHEGLNSMPTKNLIG